LDGKLDELIETYLIKGEVSRYDTDTIDE